jgi:hypothetical protein
MKIITTTDLNGDITEHILIEHLDGSQTSMPKELWDELEAAKENGTIS